jgi:hypothetical protein
VAIPGVIGVPMAAYAYSKGRYTRVAGPTGVGGVVWSDWYGEREDAPARVKVHVLEVYFQPQSLPGRAELPGCAVILSGQGESMTLFLSFEKNREARLAEYLAGLPMWMQAAAKRPRRVLRGAGYRWGM